MTEDVERSDLSPERVRAEITNLRKGSGIRGNARTRLGPTLATLAGITERDPAGAVTDKLTRLLMPAIARLHDEESQRIAEVELNLGNEGKGVVQRRRNHQLRGGPSSKGSAEKMRTEIAPELARLLLSDLCSERQP